MKLRLPHKATAWTILAGISYVLCFPRYDLPALSLLFFPCLLMAVHELRSRKQAVLLGFLLSSMVALGGFHWIVYVAQNFGEMPLPLACGLLLLFCVVAAPQMLAFLIIAERVRFRVERLPLFARPLFWSALYVALEYLAHFLKIFPENLGNTLVAYNSIAQVAAIGGAPLLTFLPTFFGAAAFYVRKTGLRPAAPALATAGALILLAQLWGSHERASVAVEPSEILRVGFIQHNMDDAEKQFAQASHQEIMGTLVGKLMAKTKELASRSPKPDLILWAETAYPTIFPTSQSHLSHGSSFASGYANLVSDTVKATGVPLLFGGYANDGKHDYNAGILLNAKGEVEGHYFKQVLLVFGEYFPFDDWFPSLKSINPMMGDFGRGPGPVPVPFAWHGGVLPLGVNICYEAILPEYMRGYVKGGARALVNITKDSWFGNTFEPWQHFQLSELRAVELRVPLIRSTNTGLSGVVAATGEVRTLSEPFHEAYETLEVRVPLQPRTTPYLLLGEWFAQLCTLLAAGTCAMFYRERRSKQLL
jgi:apolipoprotein N-acyltransferase